MAQLKLNTCLFIFRLDVSPAEINFGYVTFQDEWTKYLFLENKCDRELTFAIDVSDIGKENRIKDEKRVQNNEYKYDFEIRGHYVVSKIVFFF